MKVIAIPQEKGWLVLYLEKKMIETGIVFQWNKLA